MSAKTTCKNQTYVVRKTFLPTFISSHKSSLASSKICFTTNTILDLVIFTTNAIWILEKCNFCFCENFLLWMTDRIRKWYDLVSCSKTWSRFGIDLEKSWSNLWEQSLSFVSLWQKFVVKSVLRVTDEKITILAKTHLVSPKPRTFWKDSELLYNSVQK